MQMVQPSSYQTLRSSKYQGSPKNFGRIATQHAEVLLCKLKKKKEELYLNILHIRKRYRNRCKLQRCNGKEYQV